jgi:hypothetical protein
MTPDLPPHPIGDVADIAIVRTLSQEPKSFERIWQPYIADCKGDLLVAYGQKLVKKSDMGNLVCSRSTDHGATWSEPVTIFDSNVAEGGTRVAYANTVLYRQPGQDTVWCFGMVCPLYYPDSEDAHMCAAYSTDGGLSWQHANLAMDFHSPTIIVGGIMDVTVDGQVRHLLPAHRNTRRWDPQGDNQQFVLESTDLIEWHLAGYVPQVQPPKIFLHEGSLAPGDGPGEIKIVMRTSQIGNRLALDPPTAYSSVSSDNGHSWSVARAEPKLYNTISKGFYGKDSLGRHIYVYSDGPAWERKALKYVVQSPSGVWTEPRVFFDANTRNSYPTLIEESPGVFLCTWDSSNSPDDRRTVIRFGRLRLAPDLARN